MYDPPGYLWAITIAGITAIPAATSLVLYGGAVRAGLGRRRAALLAGGAAAVLGGWFTASAVIAGHGWYHARLGHGVPWLPVAVGRLPGLAAGAAPDPGGGARPGGAGHGEPPGASALVPGGRGGGLPAHHGPRPSARAVRPARGPGRHRCRYRRAAGRPQARAGHRPPRRPVVQRVRHDRSGRGPDPRRPHRIPAAQRHPVRRADQPAPARADPDSRRAAAVRPAHHVRVRAA